VLLKDLSELSNFSCAIRLAELADDKHVGFVLHSQVSRSSSGAKQRKCAFDVARSTVHVGSLSLLRFVGICSRALALFTPKTTKLAAVRTTPRRSTGVSSDGQTFLILPLANRMAAHLRNPSACSVAILPVMEHELPPLKALHISSPVVAFDKRSCNAEFGYEYDNLLARSRLGGGPVRPFPAAKPDVDLEDQTPDWQVTGVLCLELVTLRGANFGVRWRDRRDDPPRCIVGPHWYVMLATWSVLFLLATLVNLLTFKKAGAIELGAGLSLSGMCLTCYALVGCSDPGIVRRIETPPDETYTYCDHCDSYRPEGCVLLKWLKWLQVLNGIVFVAVAERCIAWTAGCASRSTTTIVPGRASAWARATSATSTRGLCSSCWPLCTRSLSSRRTCCRPKAKTCWTRRTIRSRSSSRPSPPPHDCEEDAHCTAAAAVAR